MATVHLLGRDPSLTRLLEQAGYLVVRGFSPGAACVLVDDDGQTIEALEAPFLVATRVEDRARIRAWREAGAQDVFTLPVSPRELIVRVEAVLRKRHRVVCIGGGTGLFHLLRGLKTMSRVHLTSIVSVFDDGGSSGKLRTEFGILPPGDVRRSLVALSDAPQLMNDVIQYRFDAGEGLKGHSLGNLILTALSGITGSLPDAVRALGDILHIRGVVLCTSSTTAALCAELADGTVVEGESAIDRCEGRAPDLRITKLWHQPEASCDLDAYAAILTADTVVIGPGDLYTSIVTNLIADGVAEAIRATAAKKIYICNVMTKPGETQGYTTADHVREVVRYLGGDHLDHVVVSDTNVPDELVATYREKGQTPVTGGLDGATRAALVAADITDMTGLVRHDSKKLARVIGGLLSVRSRR